MEAAIGKMRKIFLHILRSALFAVRPFISESRYTRLYISILQHQGVDISTYDLCGFIAPSVYFDGLDRSKIHIGKNVYLTHGTILLVHDRSPVIKSLLNSADKCQYDNEVIVNDIFIGDNVFIGMNSIVLPGSIIPDNVIVGAGSIVKGRLDSGYVYAGNPCRKIKEVE